jgi:DHA2 family multidrug resistance protein
LLPSRPRRSRPFDLKGFFLLGLALVMLQLFLDRGSSEDWLNSWEIRIEILMFISFAWLYVHHQLVAPHPVIERETLNDRNFALGLFIALMIGAVMMSVMALLPSMLQTIYGHNVFTTGLLLAPRGAGVLIALYISGHLVQRYDVRKVIAFGCTLIAYSMWEMTGWSIDMGWSPMLMVGAIQGLGTGFVFGPLNAIAFSTLPSALRTEGAGISGLARNLGGSIGISIVTALLARNIQVSHQDLVGHITSANIAGFAPNMAQALGDRGIAILHMVDAEVNRQALMIAYLDDFVMITYWALVPIPFLLLFRKMTREQRGGQPPAIDH